MATGVRPFWISIPDHGRAGNGFAAYLENRWRHLNSPRRPLGQKLRMPKAYWGYVSLSTADVLGTTLILALGGVEVNPLAKCILDHTGITGMTFYKFIIVGMVIAMCERIVRKKPKAARRVMTLAILASCLPITVVAIECLGVAFSLG